MLRTERPTPDAARIKRPEDARYYAAGIPSDYWRPHRGTLFKAFKLDESTPLISEKDQQIWWTRILEDADMRKSPHLVYLCCVGHESRAQAYAFELAKRVLDSGVTIQVDNAAQIEPPVIIEPFAVLQNVSDEMTLDRKEVVRDWIHRYNSAFRVLCVSGEPSSITGRLGVRPTIAFLINPMLQVQA